MTKLKLGIILLFLVISVGLLLYISNQQRKSTKQNIAQPTTRGLEDSEQLERKRYANEKMVEKEVTVSGGKKVIIRSPEGLGDIPPEFIEQFLPTKTP